ncbi:hexokinase 2, partial [Prunus dulcis]
YANPLKRSSNSRHFRKPEETHRILFSFHFRNLHKRLQTQSIKSTYTMGKKAVVIITAAAVCAAAAALVVRHRMRSSGRWARATAIIKELEEKCGTPIGKLRQVADAMAVEMHAGLASEGGSKLKMIISYVDNLPTGVVLCIGSWRNKLPCAEGAIGGKGRGIISQEFTEVSIPENLMVGTSDALFDYIAAELAKFVAKEGQDYQLPPGRQRELGFTFSFPVLQSSINSGTLIKWTKGFSIDDAVQSSLLRLL